MAKTTIIIPVKDEEDGLEHLLGEYSSSELYDDEEIQFIFVIDGRTSDNSREIAGRFSQKIVDQKESHGKGAAIQQAVTEWKKNPTELVIFLDADGSYPFNSVISVLSTLNEGADIVSGSRFLNNDGKNVPSYRKAGIKILTKLANTSLEKNITDSQSGFRGYSNQVIENITPSESGMGVSNEILIKASKQGLKIVEVPIIILYDGDTSTHNPISHGSSVLLSTLKFISIEHPLKFYGIPGFVFLLIGIGFLIFTVNLFTETRQILLSSAIIGVGSTIFGIILIQSSILLYAMVKLMRNKKLKKSSS